MQTRRRGIAAPLRTRLHPIAVAAACTAAMASPGVQAATFNWSGGNYLPGVTAPEPLPASDLLNINAGATKAFNGVAFTNQGTVAWNADALQGGNSALVNNAGLWDSKVDANTFVWAFGGQPQLVNTGTLRKSAGALTSLGNWIFTSNGGTAESQSGVLAFNGGSATFNAGSRFIGAGDVVINNSASFNGPFLSDNLLLAAGNHTGAAAQLQGGVAAAGLMRWTGGGLLGSWQVDPGQTLAAQAGAVKALNGTTLVNAGKLLWQTTDTLQGGNSALLTHTGLLELQQPATTVWAFGGQPGLTVAATGTVRTKAGVAFNAGNFNWVSDGGRFDAQAGASFAFNGGSARFNGGTRFTGAGSHVVNSAARFVDGFTSANLTLASGQITGGDGTPGSKALLTGQLAWSGGDLLGAWQINNNQTLTALDGLAKRLNGTSVVNLGTMKWSSTEQLQGGNSATVVNQNLIEADQSANLVWGFGGQPTFTNAPGATLRATGGATLSMGNWLIDGTGGAFDAAAGSTLLFNGGTTTFRDGTVFSGAGSNNVSNNARFIGTIQAANLSLSGGGLTGGDGTPGSRATLNGKADWSAGDLLGAWTLPVGQVITAKSGGAKRLGGTDLVIDGSLKWRTGNPVQGYNSAVMTNNGLFEARKTTNLSWVAGGQPSFVNNATGLVRASGKGTLTMGNFNIVSHGGRFETKALSTIDFNGGTVRFNDNTRYLGAGGVIQVSGNATFVGLQQSENLKLVAGNLTGGDGTQGSLATLRGPVTWQGGSLLGTWVVDAGQVLTADGAGGRAVNGASLTNAGTINVTGTGGFNMGNSASLVNDGSLLLQTDAGFSWGFGGQPSLTNNGQLRKMGGTATSVMSNIALANNGTIQVDTGTIDLPGNFANAGVMSGAGAYSLGGTLQNNGVLSPGEFTVAQSALASPWVGAGQRLAQSSTLATLTIAGGLSQGAGGQMDLQVTNATSTDKLIVGGNVVVGGTLNIGCLGTCSFAPGNQMVLLDATGTLSGTFSSVTYTGLPPGSFNVSYDNAGGRVILTATGPVNLRR